MEEELFDDKINWESVQIKEKDEFFDIDGFMNDLKKSGLNALSFLKKREGRYKIGTNSPRNKENMTISFTVKDINSKLDFQQLSLF